MNHVVHKNQNNLSSDVKFWPDILYDLVEKGTRERVIGIIKDIRII